MGNIAGGSDWHLKNAHICQKWGSTVGTAGSEFSSQDQTRAAFADSLSLSSGQDSSSKRGAPTPQAVLLGGERGAEGGGGPSLT